jgi:Tol biopolymer transport system component
MRKMIGALLSVAATSAALACSDNILSAPDEPIPQAPAGLIVSDPLANGVRADLTGLTGSLQVSAGTVAYISAAPGTLPNAVTVGIRNRTRSGPEIIAPLLDGGFDPVGVEAEAGDEISLTVSVPDHGSISSIVKVPARRPPIIVRTEPSKGRTDVALNVQIAIVFSEPIEKSSVTSSSVSLTRDGNVVAGTVTLSADGLSAEFIPNADLTAGTAYTLTVARTIRDLDGDALEQPSVVEFKTGTSTSSGNIQLLVSTTGEDLDTDGYTVYAEGAGSSQWMRVVTNGTSQFSALNPGEYTVGIYSVAGNCTIDGMQPANIASTRKVNVQAQTTTQVALAITCVRSGMLNVTTRTTGVATDADGYVMSDQYSFHSAVYHSVSANETVTITALIPGQFILTLNGVAPNCALVGPNPRTIDVEAGKTASVTFEITCIGPTQIAFVREGDIYIVNSDGTGTTRLTSNSAPDVNPAWSPDGERIAFASDRDGNREIYVMNADGTQVVRLTNNAAADYLPAWSPDGKLIAFVSERDGNAEIYVMNADGTNPRRLTGNDAIDTEPAWSPDGRKIAFRSGRSFNFYDPGWSVGNGNLYVMNADGSGITQLTSNAYPDMQPAWSPDGATIAFRSGDGNGLHDIYSMKPDGTDKKRLTVDTNYDRNNPSWSPNGGSIAFDDWDCWDYGPCPRGIVVYTSGGIPTYLLIENSSEPAWRPM